MKAKNEAELRLLVMERDNHTCRVCGNSADEIHHIISRNERPDLILETNNCIAICLECHGLTRRDVHRFKGRAQNIVLSDETYDKLVEYIDKNYGQGRRVLSIVVEQAVTLFLEQAGRIDKLYKGKGDGGGEK